MDVNSAESPLRSPEATIFYHRLDYAQALRQRSEASGLQEVLRWRGQQDGRTIRTALARCDVFVAPCVDLASGDKDGIPTAVLEAMASGCAIVASDAGSIVEAVADGVHGLIVAQRDPAALAGAVQRLADDPGLAARLAGNALARARTEFDVAASEAPFHQRVRAAIAARTADRSRAR